MTATNHALTGALIGCLVGNPWVAVPAALASHFVCDAIPHFGSKGNSEDFIATRRFTAFLLSDMALCVLLVFVLAVAHPQHWLLAAVCAFAATSPDLTWLPGYIRRRRGGAYKTRNRNIVLRFAAAIQWFEKPIGGVVEAAWAIGAVTLLVAYLR